MGFWDFAMTLRAGDSVSVPLWGLWKHVGVVIGRTGDMPIVASLSAEGYREQTLAGFVGRGPWWVARYRGSLSAHELQRNARWRGHHRYNLEDWNCEHFACVVQGRIPRSAQVSVTRAIVGGLVAFGVSRMSPV